MLPKRLINEDVEYDADVHPNLIRLSAPRAPGQFRCRLEGFTSVKRKIIHVLHLEIIL